MSMKYTIKIVTAFILFIIWFSMCIKSQHPSDQKLIVNFRVHHTDFERLLTMFYSEPNLSRVGYDFFHVEDSKGPQPSIEHLAAYRSLFDTLGLEAGIEAYGTKNEVRFLASTAGLGISGSAKGYIYLSTPPDKIVENLDDYRSDDGKSFTAFRHLEGPWYLYFDYED